MRFAHLWIPGRRIAQYAAGRTKLLGFFVGQTMKATQGKANPALVNQLLQELLPPTDG